MIHIQYSHSSTIEFYNGNITLNNKQYFYDIKVIDGDICLYWLDSYKELENKEDLEKQILKQFQILT